MLTRLARGVARDAVVEMNAGQVGVHLGAFVVGAAGPEDAAVAVHRFAAQVPGYPGWEWQAVVACAAGSSYVTVNEVSLVPSPSGTALRAPEWVPFAQRVRPGDLKPGMTLPPAVGDERLTENGEDSATRATDDERSAAARRRKFYLSRRGRDETAARWGQGERGPEGEYARQAVLYCETCAFYLPLGRQLENFGVCANKFAADGEAVHARFGCGAHSETPQAGGDHGPGYRPFDDERPVF